jgi:cellulose synthase/poly-beta-1,6-N-acetylglucosamine synthase-like glycosyltransferase
MTVPVYAAISPVRNEADNLPRLARALAAQSVRPSVWWIVDNGSTDSTLEVAGELAAGAGWIRLLEVPGERGAVRGRPIVRAFHAALTNLAPAPDVVVNLDADVSMGEDYFERLLQAFTADPSLGIAGGTCYERQRGGWRERHVTGNTVWGASRAYRWDCLQEVLPLEERLGWDGVDELKANARGWRTATVRDLPFYHHRREGERDGLRVKARAAQGRSAHFMGYRPWYLVLRALGNTLRDPAAPAMIWGYGAAALTRQPRCADDAARAYLRQQQSLRTVPLRVREALGRRPE